MEHPPLPRTAKEESLRTLVLVSYVLMAVGLFLGVTALVAVIICHIKRGEAGATLYESHFTWLIRTFWLGLLGTIISGVLTIIGIGVVLSVAVWVWAIYRVVKGFLIFNDRRPIPEPRAWV